MFVRLGRMFAALLALGILLTTVTPAAAAPRVQQPTLLTLALEANASGPFKGQLDTLIAAVLAADPAVAQTLAGKGQFTVFAPTDDAFAALGLTPANVGTLNKAFLTEVLLYHVARGSRDAASVTSSERIRMLSGGFLRQSGGTLTDNLGRTANIIAVNVRATNGIIHVIDQVVLPKAP